MRKVWVIAVREYRAIVGTKAFMIALVMMPVLMFGGIGVQKMLEGRVGPTEKKIVVLDEHGRAVRGPLEGGRRQSNENEIFDLGSGKQIKPRYLLERGPAGKVTEETRFAAFRAGPPPARSTPSWRSPPGSPKLPAEGRSEPGPLLCRKRGRGRREGLASASYRRNRAHAPACKRPRSTRNSLSAPSRRSRSSPWAWWSGLRPAQITKPQQANIETTIFVPFGAMMLMWLVIFLAAQPMLESVMEEKSQRIAEVLLGSVNAFQLMVGKLLGGVGGSLTVVLIYGAGVCGLAAYFDALHVVPLRVIPWFLVYQVLAVMLFGSLFMAIGASVSQLKEAQSMLLPVWLIMMIPLFVWYMVVREPMGELRHVALVLPAGHADDDGAADRRHNRHSVVAAAAGDRRLLGDHAADRVCRGADLPHRLPGPGQGPQVRPAPPLGDPRLTLGTGRHPFWSVLTYSAQSSSTVLPVYVFHSSGVYLPLRMAALSFLTISLSCFSTT